MKFPGTLLLVASLSLAACAHRPGNVDVVPSRCDRPSPSPPGPVSFKAEVIGFEADALHYEFDVGDAYFSAATLRFVGPEEWKGMTESAYYQDDPIFGGKQLSVGATIEFVATPPACLDSPWLFEDAPEAYK